VPIPLIREPGAAAEACMSADPGYTAAMTAARSWVVTALCLGFGIVLWTFDDFPSERLGPLGHRIYEAIEFVIYVPGLALAGFLIAERFRQRSAALARLAAQAQQERLAGLGLIAAGVAHEVRNPLHILKLLSQELAEPDPDDPRHASLQRQIRRLDRAVNMTYQLAGGHDRAAVSDLHAALLAAISEEGAAGRCVVGGPAPLPVQAQADILAIVLANLVRNAVHAVSEPTDRGAAGTITAALAVQGRRAVLTLSNPGTLAARSGRGLGIGLQLCEQLASRLGAELDIAQRDDQVVVSLSLPMAGS
jgi:signal transduction histidine kinase